MQSCSYTVINIVKEAKTYADLTGRFPHQSSRENNYIFVAYTFDRNAILTNAIPNRDTNNIIAARKFTYARLQQNRITPTHYV